MDKVIALFVYTNIAITLTSTPFPPHECSLTQHLDYTDYIIDPQRTASFLDEADNLFWIKLYEPDNIIQERWLFSINTSFNFDAMYNYILLTTNIYGNFNKNSNYYITQINPKFFISDNNNYIGISFDDGAVSFTGTSCNGTSALLNSTSSISYTNGYTNNTNTSFGGSHIKIMIELNRNDSNTLVLVQWTDTTETKHHQAICHYNTLFNDTSNIVFKTASAINDDYYRFSHINFKFCGTAPGVNMSQTNIIGSSAPTPAPTDFIYVGCPAYKLKLSDFTQLDAIIHDSQVNYFSTSNHQYTYSFVNKPTKKSEWLLSSSTYINNIIDSDTSLKIRVNIAPNIGCKNTIITLQDVNQFVSIYFTQQTIGFYPPCDTSLSYLPYPWTIYETYPDPASSITYDTNNIIWEQGLDITINPQIIFVFDVLVNKTTATITSQLNETKANVEFKCTWNDLFTSDDIFQVLLASSTDQPCGITDIEVEYCAIEWDYPLDFCENITSASQLQLWSDTNTFLIGQEIVHGLFDQNKASIDVTYDNVPQHELVDITTTFYVSTNLLNNGDIIQFQITLGTNTKTLATYIGNTVHTCTPPWNQTIERFICAFKTKKINFNHTSNSLNIIVSFVGTFSGSFNWAFDNVCIDQSFQITNAPTNSPSAAPTNTPTIPTLSPTNAPTRSPIPAPTNIPTIPTLSPTNAPTQPPTLAPTAAPTHPTNAPTNAPTQPPTSSPTKAPTIPPTNAPTFLPTIAPSNAPTIPPTTAPTNPPTIAPSIAPTTPPTNAPSQPPTNAPSNSPTTPPTNFPTISPTTSPTLAPTLVSMSPTNAPTNTPTFSPTNNPTRYPITSREYDSFFLIKYLIKHLENEYIEIWVNNIIHITNDIIEIIEQSYLELTGLKYHFFRLKIENILGYKITEINHSSQLQDIIYMDSKIECDKISCYLLQLEEEDIKYEFESMVTNKLRKYFADYRTHIYNISSQLIFQIESFGKIEVLYPEEPISVSELMNQNKLLSALVIMMIISVFVSFLALLHNKQMFCIVPGGSLMDSTIWFALIIYILHIVNFLSEIKLCIEILYLSIDNQFTDLRINICAISCIVFIIIPYAINVRFTQKLTKIIATTAIGNVNAILFFQESEYLMMILFLICGDIYTVIYFLSSSIFGLRILNSGLSKYELKKLSKMKIISTIIFQNIPQICIQCTFAAIIHNISATIAFAFITSILSIIVTPVNYRNLYASYFSYYVEIKNSENKNENEIDKYSLHKGKTQQMAKIFYHILGEHITTCENDIEISRNSIVNASNDGIILYVTHKISSGNIFGIMKLYQEKQQRLQTKFKQHFNLNGSCILLFKIINQQNGNVITNDNNYSYEGGITGKDDGEQQKYNTANTIELQTVKQKDLYNNNSINYDNDKQSEESSDFSFPV